MVSRAVLHPSCPLDSSCLILIMYPHYVDLVLRWRSQHLQVYCFASSDNITCARASGRRQQLVLASERTHTHRPLQLPRCAQPIWLVFIFTRRTTNAKRIFTFGILCALSRHGFIAHTQTHVHRFVFILRILGLNEIAFLIHGYALSIALFIQRARARTHKYTVSPSCRWSCDMRLECVFNGNRQVTFGRWISSTPRTKVDVAASAAVTVMTVFIFIVICCCDRMLGQDTTHTLTQMERFESR